MIELRYTFCGKVHRISREAIVAAMRRYDSLHKGHSVRRTGRKYYVWFRGKPYPPKEILRHLEHGPTGKFSGGSASNQVFVDLEFYVGKANFPQRLRASASAIPSIGTLKRRLMSQRWRKLEPNFLPDDQGKHPGVYLFTLSRRPLTNKPVELADIFYVGSSCTGINARLNQFFKGKTQDCCHSAAMRFYRRWRRRTDANQDFYVALVTIPSETRKEIRSERDILKMGRVAELEYAVLGHIKKYTGFEPLLNRK